MHTLNLTFQIALKAWIFPSDLTIGFPTLSLAIKMMMILKWWKKDDNEMNTMKYEIKLRTLLFHAYCETTEGFQMHCDVIIMVQLTWWDLESHVSILKKGSVFWSNELVTWMRGRGHFYPFTGDLSVFFFMHFDSLITKIFKKNLT